jgi:hypothetical protein
MKKKNILGKFTIVAAMIGFFSPSVSVQTDVKSAHNSYSAAPIQLNISLLNTAEARRGGGRGGASRGGSARRSSGASRSGGSARRGSSTTRNKNRNVNRNKNVNRNVNRNVNVNHRYYGGHPPHRGFYGGGGYYYGGSYHPVARFTFAMLTAVAIGTIISSASMSSSCTTMNVSGISYKQCDGTWFKLLLIDLEL